MNIQGTVSAAKNKDGKFGIKIGEEWYNGFGEANCKKGDVVEVEFKQNGKWKNVDSIKVITSAPFETADKYSQKDQKDYRINVDAGNILQRVTEVINGLSENLAVKSKVLSDGVLGDLMVKEFIRIRTALETEATKETEHKSEELHDY